FKPIATRTPGLSVCELMPRTARLADRIAVLRAVATNDNAHSSSGYQMLTGVPHQPPNAESATPKPPNNWPSLGAIVRYQRPDATAGYDLHARKALDLLGSAKARQAFNLDHEPATVRDRYGRSRYAQSVLLARRLVEAGVALVQINWTRIKGQPNQGGWDT